MRTKQLYKLLGDNIKQARLKAGLNQTDLASRIDLSRTSIVNIEHGRQHPTLHLLWIIAETLQIAVHDLIPTTIDSSATFEVNTVDIANNVSDKSHQSIIDFIETIKNKSLSHE